MNKKLLTTAIVCTLSAACIFGATACNSGSGDNGGGAPDVGPSVQVDEAGWIDALGKTYQAHNLTYYRVTDYSDKSMPTFKSTVYAWGDEQYVISDDSLGQQSNREYAYTLIENSEIYSSVNQGKYSNGWVTWASIFGVGLPDGAANGSDFLLDYKVRFESFEIFARYSEFTYSDGKYTATLSVDWYRYDYSVTIKINSDGYISYFCFEENQDGMICKDEYTFYNYGKTSYSVPEEAKKVVEDYKNAKN